MKDKLGAKAKAREKAEDEEAVTMTQVGDALKRERTSRKC
jgi:hypothetical protein